MELARAMAVRRKLLISDEAMAGLSSSEVDEVLDLLISLGKEDITIIMIEHVMQAVMRFSERVMCLDAGKIIAIGAPAEVMANNGCRRPILALSLAIEGLDAGYGAVKALRGVTLHVEAGETVALLGTTATARAR